MNIAVFGTGIVGQVIATRLTGLKHRVTIGTRDVLATKARTGTDKFGNPEFGSWYQSQQSTIGLDTFGGAAQSADIIFNCTSGQGSVSALQQATAQHLAGKIIVDVANPLDFSKGAPPSLNPCNTDSLGELIQRTFPDAKVVKTLNTMNCFLMMNPTTLKEEHNVFVCGNDGQAKAQVKELLESIGWQPSSIIDLGDITSARATEQLLPIWLRLYMSMKHANFNFKVVTK